MIDYTLVWAVLSTIGALILAYLNYRKAEIIALAMEVVRAYSDKTITEEEYKLIVDKLEIVLNK